MRVIELKESITASNDRDADALREEMRREGTLLVNLMSSPGSGKTTLLSRIIEDLGGVWKVAVLEADIDAQVDAERIEQKGARSIQVHTDGMCHMDAGMTRTGLREMGTEGIDLAFLENVGNLICPAEFDTGAGKNVMLLSVPEGDDKPLKYPGMFQVAEAVILNKMDTLPVFDFDVKAFEDEVDNLNPGAPIFHIAATKDDGVKEWTDWLTEKIEAVAE